MRKQSEQLSHPRSIKQKMLEEERQRRKTEAELRGKIFGRRIKLARVSRDLNQKDLAQSLGISVSQLVRIEAGTMPPWDLGERIRLTLDLDVSVDQLITGEVFRM